MKGNGTLTCQCKCGRTVTHTPEQLLRPTIQEQSVPMDWLDSGIHDEFPRHVYDACREMWIRSAHVHLAGRVFVNIKAGCICFGSTACVRFHHFRITQTRLGCHRPQEISNLIVSELPNSDRLREEALSAVMSLDQPKELFAHTRIIEAKQRLSNGRFCPRFRISGRRIRSP